ACSPRLLLLDGGVPSVGRTAARTDCHRRRRSACSVPPVREDGGGAWRQGTLAEVREGDATAEVAEIYEDIRAVFGVSFVVLVYRALATDPARLRAAWDAVRPNLAGAEIDRLAGALAAPGEPVEPAARASARVPAGSRLDPGRLAD